LAGPVAEPETVLAELPEKRPTARVAQSPPGWGAAAVLAPSAAALAVLLVHRLLPGRLTAPPIGPDSLLLEPLLAADGREALVLLRRHPLPFLLETLLAAGLLVAVVQWLWRPLRPWARHTGPLLAGAIGMLGVWDVVTLKLAWLRPPYFFGPDQVLQVIVDKDECWLLLDSAYHSLRLLLTGYVTGVSLGFVWGVLMGWFRGVRYWGMPVMKVLGPLPATALVPLMLLLFPSTFVAGAALIALAVWFPVTVLTMSGISNVPSSYFDVARTLGARRAFLIFRVAIPAAMPSIFIGLFSGLLTSFLMLIVAETVGVSSGLGYYLLWRKGAAEFDKVYACLVIMAAFFYTILTLLFKARDRVLSWQKGMIRW
jgi:NitT/TauT family transport system permease protein